MRYGLTSAHPSDCLGLSVWGVFTCWLLAPSGQELPGALNVHACEQMVKREDGGGDQGAPPDVL